MTRRRQALIAVLAAATLLSLGYLAVRPGSAPEGVPVPVAAVDVQAGAVIDAAMLTVVRMPLALVPGGAVRTVEEAVGLRATVALHAGETILSDRLAEEATGTVHAAPGPGRRIYALALRAEDAGGWWLSEGSAVDVHLLWTDPDGAPCHEILPSVRVAGVMDAKGHLVGGSDSSGDATPGILCLDVDTDQARRLTETENDGHIKVIIVNETMQ
jgi:Flp pilus assembly protein CpaB